jgi:hypothetical protein
MFKEMSVVISKIKEILLWLIPYLIGGVLGLFSWSILELIFSSLKNSDIRIIVAVIAAFGTFITGVIVALVNHSRIKDREFLVQEKISEREIEVQKAIREREIDESHRQKKVEIYNDFLKLVSSYIQGANEDNRNKLPKQQKIIDETEKFQNGILLWGGPKVIASYLNYRKQAEVGTSEMFISIDQFYRALREDIGLSNEGLENLETIQLYLKDPNEVKELVKT